MKPRKVALIGVSLMTPALTAAPAAAKAVMPPTAAENAAPAQQAAQTRLMDALLSLDAATKLQIAGHRVSGQLIAQVSPSTTATRSGQASTTPAVGGTSGSQNTGPAQTQTGQGATVQASGPGKTPTVNGVHATAVCNTAGAQHAPGAGASNVHLATVTCANGGGPHVVNNGAGQQHDPMECHGTGSCPAQPAHTGA